MWCIFESAYGRRYRTSAEALADFHADKDFLVCADARSAYSTKREMIEMDYTGFEIRYGQRNEHLTTWSHDE